MLLRTEPAAIQYGWVKAGDRYQFVVTIPDSAPVSDRRVVVEWLADYAATVRALRPLWTVVLRSNSSGYYLDVLPGQTVQQTISNGIRLLSEGLRSYA